MSINNDEELEKAKEELTKLSKEIYDYIKVWEYAPNIVWWEK